MSVLKKLTQNRYVALGDIAIIILCYIFAFFLCDVTQNLHGNLVIIVSTCVIYFTMFLLTRIYRRCWAFSGATDYMTLLGSCIAAAITSLALTGMLHPTGVRFREYVAIHILILFSTVFLRLAVRVADRYLRYVERRKTAADDGKRVLIYGAGGGAFMFLRETHNSRELHYNVVGIVDDDPKKYHQVIYGYKVIGCGDELKELCVLYEVDEIIIAIPSASSAVKGKIVQRCSDTGCIVKTIPMLDEIIDGKNVSSVRRISIEDLLARDPIELNCNNLAKLIRGKTVAVTGGGGSIGSELCRQIAAINPKKLIIIDIYENNAYDLQNELSYKFPQLNLEVYIASVRDKQRIDDLFEQSHPDIVFHAAAHKHVPLMEDSPGEAIKNNVFGTFNVARSAMEHGVARFVMISTDKAVNPTNVMGATKRLCEMIVQSLHGKSDTDFVAVRFGNVLGSNGSVIPLFKRQIENGGPVTITDKRIIRYFMTIPEAAQLVLQAASTANGGEIFVLDMGAPVKIYDLAVNLIKLSGYVPNVDIMIKEIGLRPGEKLYEELLMNEEGLGKTGHDKIFIGKPLGIPFEEVEEKLEVLKKALETEDNFKIKEAVAQVVPTYKIDRRGLETDEEKAQKAKKAENAEKLAALNYNL